MLLEGHTKPASSWEEQRPKKKKKCFAEMGYRSPLSAAAAGCPPQAQAQLPEGLQALSFPDGPSLMRSPLSTVGGMTLLMEIQKCRLQLLSLFPDYLP